jgi:hypothetical protein
VTRVISLLLSVLLALPACALRSSSRLPSPIAVARRAIEHRQVPVAGGAVAWSRYLAALPVGSRVKVSTTDGRSFKAIYMGTDDDEVTMRPRTRIPEPLRRIPIASLASVELDQGMGVGKIVAISAAVAGATVLTILLVLLATLDD